MTTSIVLAPHWVGGKAGYRYDAVLDGETIVSRSRTPEHDACRALLARGVKGKMQTFGEDGVPRLTFDIEKAAGWTVVERVRRAPSVEPYREIPSEVRGRF